MIRFSKGNIFYKHDFFTHLQFSTHKPLQKVRTYYVHTVLYQQTTITHFFSNLLSYRIVSSCFSCWSSRSTSGNWWLLGWFSWAVGPSLLAGYTLWIFSYIFKGKVAWLLRPLLSSVFCESILPGVHCKFWSFAYSVFCFALPKYYFA